jgi:hypothetical protein
MNKLTFYIQDNNKITVKTQHPIDFEELLQYTQTAVLNYAKQIISFVPEETPEDAEKVKGFLYDQMNYAFSRTLEFFAPEYELRPGLTAEAILKAEDEILEQHFKKKETNK